MFSLKLSQAWCSTHVRRNRRDWSREPKAGSVFVGGLGSSVFLYLERHSYNGKSGVRHSHTALCVSGRSVHTICNTTRITGWYLVLYHTCLDGTCRPQGK